MYVPPPALDANGYISSIEIKMDGSLVWWESENSCPPYNDPQFPNYLPDFYSVVLHEIGHVLGLGDVTCPDPVMTDTYAGGTCKRSLTTDDQTAIQFLYDGTHFMFGSNRVDACSNPDNPDADVSAMTYVDGNVKWHTLREQNTGHYVIEGCRQLNGVGAEPLAEEASGLGVHIVPVTAGDYPLLRLVEVESTGRRILREITASVTPPLAHKSTLAQEAPVDTVRSLVSVSSRKIELGPIRAVTTSSPPTIAIYGTANLASGIAALQDYYESRGETVGGYVFQGDEPNLDDLVKSEIVTTNQTYGTKRFHLVGSWRYGDWSCSDQPYADVNGDGIPDVVVTRWPALTVNGITNMLSKLATYKTSAKAQAHPGDALFLVGDVDGLNGNSGPYATWCSDYVEEHALPTSVTTSQVLTTSPVQNLDASVRNLATASQINSERPDVITMFATNSDWDAPGGFFNQVSYLSHPWSMNDLTSGCFVRVVIAASCATARWYATDPAPNPPTVAWRFVNSPTRGALAWVGPSHDSFQGTNLVVSEFLQEELWNHPYQSMADSWLIAMQRAYAEFAGDQDSLIKLSWWEFIGDPITPFVESPLKSISTLVDNSYDHVLRSASSVPLVSCPRGDGDKLVVKVDLNADLVMPYADANFATLTAPEDPSPGVVEDGKEVVFMKSQIPADSFVFEAIPFAPDVYHVSWTVPNIGGSGLDSTLVSLFGTPLGWAKFTAKSYDVKPRTGTLGEVGLPDFSYFAMAYESSRCNCKPTYKKPYLPWCDFLKNGDAAHTLPDTIVTTNDFSFWSFHYDHTYTAPQLTTEVNKKAVGTISLEFQEDQPVIGQRRLRGFVRLEGVNPFEVMMIRLKNDNDNFVFSGWTQDANFGGRTMCAQVPRDDGQQIMLGLASDGGGAIADQVLGYFDINVMTDEPIALGEEDFALVSADVLGLDNDEYIMYGSDAHQSFGRALVPASFHNELAQCYPNPFNPRTTIAFSIAKSEKVRLEVFDVAGHRVRELLNQHHGPGVYKVTWDGTDARGSRIASGVYFYKFVAGSFTDTKKMIMLK